MTTDASVATGGRVLIIDDDPDFARIAEVMLRPHGYELIHALDEAGAVEQIARAAPDVILLDHCLGSLDGIELLRPLKQQAPATPIVLVTAHGTVEIAVRAIKHGAFDFLPKPLEEARAIATLSRCVEHAALTRRVQHLEGDSGPEDHSTRFAGMVGQSHPMQTIFRIIRNVAPTNASVMIIGESGTGKELIARAIHDRSKRREDPFVALNMGAMQRDLIESTLYGHERGAFTGAAQRRIGACEEATGGTLFLDEIREMPIEMQSKLLRFLQERVFRRVGGSGEIVADVRIISATNRDPLIDVREGRLRDDLYYRLNLLPIAVPPLRERREDIPILATFALRQAAARHGKEFESISPRACEHLSALNWPGNVRQLFHTVERVSLLNEGRVLTPEMIPLDVDLEIPPAPHQAAETSEAPTSTMPRQSTAAVRPLAAIERDAILQAIEVCGSAAKAARGLGVSEATIYRRLRDYDANTP